MALANPLLKRLGRRRVGAIGAWSMSTAAAALAARSDRRYFVPCFDPDLAQPSSPRPCLASSKPAYPWTACPVSTTSTEYSRAEHGAGRGLEAASTRRRELPRAEPSQPLPQSPSWPLLVSTMPIHPIPRRVLCVAEKPSIAKEISRIMSSGQSHSVSRSSFRRRRAGASCTAGSLDSRHLTSPTRDRC